jgi:hypothetical protein
MAVSSHAATAPSVDQADAPANHLQGKDSEPLLLSPRKETESVDELLPSSAGAQDDIDDCDTNNPAGSEAKQDEGEPRDTTTPPTPPRRLSTSKDGATKAPPKRSSRIQALNVEAGGAEHKQQQLHQSKQREQQELRRQASDKQPPPSTPPPTKKPSAEAQRSQDRSRTGDSRSTVLALEARVRRQAVNAGKPFTPPLPRHPGERRALGPELEEAEDDDGSHNTDLRTTLEKQVQEAARDAQVEVEKAEAANRNAKAAPKSKKTSKKSKKSQKKADDSASRPSQRAKAAIINSMTVSPNLREGGSGTQRPSPVTITELFASPAKTPARQSPHRSNE